MAESQILFFAGKVSTSVVPDGILADIKKLKSLKPDQLDLIVGAVLSFMSNPSAYDFGAATSKITSSLKVSSSVLKGIFKAMLIFFKGVLKYGVSSANVKKDLMTCGVKEVVLFLRHLLCFVPSFFNTKIQWHCMYGIGCSKTYNSNVGESIAKYISGSFRGTAWS